MYYSKLLDGMTICRRYIQPFSLDTHEEELTTAVSELKMKKSAL